MCVIAICSEIPKSNVIKKMYDTNPDGAGIAWREKDFIHWKKGLSLEQVEMEITNKPLPFVLHFRLASVGRKTKELCHPFPITKNVELNETGKAKSVLFHNGHWSKWKEACFEMTVRRNLTIPNGEWSDTRAIAWIVYHNSEKILHFINEKICIFSVNGIRLYGEWQEHDKMIVSNKNFCHSYTNYYNYYKGNAKWYDLNF